MVWLRGKGIGRGEGPLTGPRQIAYIDKVVYSCFFVPACQRLGWRMHGKFLYYFYPVTTL